MKFIAALFVKFIGLSLLLTTTLVMAIEPFVVKDIRVEGIQRTEVGTVFSYLPIKVGDRLDDERATTAIRALFATGMFNDIRLEVDQGVLIVQIRERPTIASIALDGIKDFPQEKILESLKSVGLAEGLIFDKATLDKAEQELKRQYVARGKYGAAVKTTITELERNRVGVTLNVTEGETSKISQINIIGNKAYSEAELHALMELSVPGFWSWFTKDDQYSKQKLSADLETIRSFYLDAGYLEFVIESTQVSITSDKQEIYITIKVREGDKYTVSDVKLVGPQHILPHEEMRKLITVMPGSVFSRKELTESAKKISDRLGEDGYAFANANAVPELDQVNHKVAFTFMVDPGMRAYIRRIDITGNTKTRDEVIRREFRQMEGAWFDTSKIKKSKQKVDRLDFFSEVNIETPQVVGTNDQLDISLSVKEKLTGDFSLGAGLSSGVGLIFTGSITERNLFGTGNHLTTQINTSKVNQIYSMSYTNPYYTDEGVSRSFDLYKRDVNSARTGVISPYRTQTLGTGIRLGVPIGDDESIFYGLSVEQTALSITTVSPARVIQYVDLFGASTTNLTGTIGWGYDNRDSAIYTTEGTVQRATVSATLPPSNQKFYKLNYQHQWFYPLSKIFTLRLNGEIAKASGYDGEVLPFTQNYYAGGPDSMRGYRTNSLGPRDDLGNSLGGDRRVIGNMELLFPMPGLTAEKSVRLSAFIDGGAVYGPSNVLGTTGLRYAAGMALTWISPVGPLKISIANGLNKQNGDKLDKIQFTLGSLF